MSVALLKKNPPSSDTNLFMESLQVQQDLRCFPLSTVQRNLIDAEPGMIIYNSDNADFEGYKSNMWVSISDGGPGPTGPTGAGVAGPTGFTGPTGPTSLENYINVYRNGPTAIDFSAGLTLIPFDVLGFFNPTGTGGWSLDGSGGAVVPTTGTYSISYTVTVRGGTGGAGVDSIIVAGTGGGTGDGFFASHVLTVVDQDQQQIMGTSFIFPLTAGNALYLMVGADGDASVPGTTNGQAGIAISTATLTVIRIA